MSRIWDWKVIKTRKFGVFTKFLTIFMECYKRFWGHFVFLLLAWFRPFLPSNLKCWYVKMIPTINFYQISLPDLLYKDFKFLVFCGHEAHNTFWNKFFSKCFSLIEFGILRLLTCLWHSSVLGWQRFSRIWIAEKRISQEVTPTICLLSKREVDSATRYFDKQMD